MAHDEPAPSPVITVSAAYGAGGSVIAPRLADRLGLPFYDRLLRGSAAQRHPHQIAERLTEEERRQTPAGRIATSLTHMGAGFGYSPAPPPDLYPYEPLRQQVETSITRVAETGGGVILGRGGSVVLMGRRGVFHCRLDGPLERRIVQGAEIENITEDAARQHQADTDRAWTRFVKQIFDRDPADFRLYHLMLDSTSVPLERCVDVIQVAAEAYWDHVGVER
jgi:cytidylate kinase